ncbi:MAG: methyltransferase [Melioribacter sp.]|nr:methyltransferase [Melioribacter sp.]
MEKIRLKVTSSKLFDVNIVLSDFTFKPSQFTRSICESLNLMENDKMGNILDIGTGSGVIAIVLAKMGCRNVFVTELVPEVLEIAKLNCSLNNSNIKEFILSDLFNNIPSNLKFDLIVTNPPAYPINSNLKLNTGMDVAVFSGFDGREYILRFLSSVKNYLSIYGRFLIAVPSFLDWTYIEDKFNEDEIQYRSLLCENCVLPTYGYPKDIFINNFLSHFNKNFYIVKESGKTDYEPYLITDTGQIQFNVKIYEGRIREKKHD